MSSTSTKAFSSRKRAEYDDAASRDHARIAFLAAMNRRAPLALAGLHELVHCVLSSFIDQVARDTLEVIHLEDGAYRPLLRQLVDSLRPAVYFWADQYRLADRSIWAALSDRFILGPVNEVMLRPEYLVEWLLPATALSLLRSHSRTSSHFQWDLEAIYNQMDHDWESMKYAYWRWRPHLERRQDYLKRQLKRFSQRLKIDMDRVAIETSQRGDSIVRIGPRLAERHYDWLVDFQVLGKNWTQMAKAAGCDRSAVRVAARKAAIAILGDKAVSWLRASNPGRPAIRTQATAAASSKN